VSSLVSIGPAVWPAIRNIDTYKQTDKQTYRLLLNRLLLLLGDIASAIPPIATDISASGYVRLSVCLPVTIRVPC